MEMIKKRLLVLSHWGRECTNIVALLGALLRFLPTDTGIVYKVFDDVKRIISSSNAFILVMACFCAMVSGVLVELDASQVIIAKAAEVLRNVAFPFICLLILVARSGLYNTASIYDTHETFGALKGEDGLIMQEMAHLLLSGVFSIVVSYLLINFYFFVAIELYHSLSSHSSLPVQQLYPEHFFTFNAVMTLFKMIFVSLITTMISIYYGVQFGRVETVVTTSVTMQLNLLILSLLLLSL